MSSLRVHTTGSSEPAPLAKGTLRVYGNRFCPFTYRIRLVLAAKDIPYEIINIDLRNKPEWYLVKNPEGKVPLMEFDNHVLHESLIVTDYLDKAYPGVTLWPDDPLDIAKGKILIERIGKMAGLNGKIYREKDYSVYKDILEEFNFFNKVLQKMQKPYFSGNTIGMVDYMIWPFFEVLLCIAELGLGGNVPNFASVDERPALASWIDKMQNDPAVQKATTGRANVTKFFHGFINGQFDYNIGLTS